MNMMISYQELVRTFPNTGKVEAAGNISHKGYYFVNNGSMTAQSGFVTNNGKKIK